MASFLYSSLFSFHSSLFSKSPAHLPSGAKGQKKPIWICFRIGFFILRCRFGRWTSVDCASLLTGVRQHAKRDIYSLLRYLDGATPVSRLKKAEK